MPLLRAQVLGGFTLSLGDEPLPLTCGPAARSLLAYLLTHREEACSRDLLAGTFWPDLPNAVARRRLTQALWQLRRDVCMQLPVLAQGDAVLVDPAAAPWVDLDEFERLAAGGPHAAPPAIEQLERAAALYRGELLAGYYDDWLLGERERVRDLFLEVLERLSSLHRQQGHFERALQWARRLAAEDPWREEAHRDVMRLCHLLGRGSEALHQYELCRRALLEELALAPAEETVALAREIARAAPSAEAPYLPHPAAAADHASAGAPDLLAASLVGRAQERAVLSSCLDAAIQGLGGASLVEGEAGVGKTRLLQEVARDAGWRGVQVLWGHSRPEGLSAPYGPWVEALQGASTPLRVEQWQRLVDPVWLRVLAPLLPALEGYEAASPIEPEREQERLVNAFLELLAGWSRAVPLVLILEDLHWADEDSLRILPALGQRLRTRRVLLVASYRGDEARSRAPVWQALQRLEGPALRTRLVLSPLEEPETGELVQRALGLRAPAPLFASRLHQETGGNPLFVLEVLRALHDQGVLYRDEQGAWSTAWDAETADYGELAVPVSVERAIARRLELLDLDERRTLGAAAVLGVSFSFDMLQETAGQQPSALIGALDSLVRRRLLIEQPSALRFGHGEILRVAYEALEDEQRREFHRRAAAALEAGRADGLQGQVALAHHLAGGGVWDRAVEAYAAAGRQAAAVYAVSSALQAYEQAIAILREQQPSGSEAGARQLFDLVAARCALLQMRSDGQAWGQAVQELRSLAGELGDTERQVEALLQAAAYAERALTDYPASRGKAEEALALAESLGMRQAQARAWLMIGTAWKQQGDNDRALKAYRRVLELREPGDTDSTELYASLVMTYRDLGDLEQAGQVALLALEQARAGDDPLVAARVHNVLAWIARAGGDHRAEAKHCREMLGHMRAIGHRYYEGVALNNLSLACSALGDYGEAIRAGEQALEVFRQIDHLHGQAITLLNLSSRYKATGQVGEVRRVLDEGLALARELSLADDECRMLCSLADLLTQAGDHAAAGAALARAEELARDLRSDYLLATALFRSGELALAAGDSTRAIDCLQRSIEQYERSGYDYYVTTTRALLAAACLQQGDLATAVRLSSQAMAEADAHADMPLSLDLYYHHFRIMTAAGEARRACDAIERAHQEVQRRLATLDDPAWRRGFIRDMPLHRDIESAWQALQPRTVTARIAREDAPSGRPLGGDDYVSVTWTLSAPDDPSGGNAARLRRYRLARLLREAAEQGAAPTVVDLADALEVSVPTVRRDLAVLRQEGEPAPTRGHRGPAAAPG